MGVSINARSRFRAAAACATGWTAVVLGSQLAVAGPPATPKQPVVDSYHGVKVTDDYRWLENWDDPKVQSWSAAQNTYARSVLDRLPGVGAIRTQVTKLRKIDIPRHYGVAYEGGTLFAMRYQPPKQQPFLVAMASEDDTASARIVVDPNVIDPKGTTSIDWYVPSPDGKRVAISLSEGGSESGNAHVYDTATGREIGEPIQRINGGTAGGSLTWDADGNGFYYTRYPREGERAAADMDFYLQVYHHRLATPASQDQYEIGKTFPRIAEIALDRSRDGRWILANVANGDGGEYAQYLRSSDGTWTQLSQFEDRVVDAVFGPDQSLFLLSRAGAARGKLMRLSLRDAGSRGPSLAGAKPFVPQGRGVIQFAFYAGSHGIVATDSRVFVVEQRGGPERLRVFDLAGKEQQAPPVPPVSSVDQVVALHGRAVDEVLYQTESYLEPPTWYRSPAAMSGSASAVKTALSRPWPVDFSDAVVVRDSVISKDGTCVPISILRPKAAKPDGTNPTRLTAYGGYGVSLTPGFNVGLRAWLDRGGVLVIANLRGGGEFGEEWHMAGNLTKKQNVFDDFIACADHLVRSGWTTAERLVIEGGSNGGLLMGAALTQRPDLFNAVVSHVGIYDMLRVELSPNGAFNVTEFGTVKDKAQFEALYAYSPYHHVVDGKKYPAILFLTGANDPRVDPMQSRKMTARLQAAGAEVLLRTSATSGHGIGTSLDERIEQEVDVLAFLFDRLGMSVAAPAVGAR
jgi:prolyl oligopeptidase